MEFFQLPSSLAVPVCSLEASSLHVVPVIVKNGTKTINVMLEQPLPMPMSVISV